MNHALLPFGVSFPTVANVFVVLDVNRPVSATHALLAALVAPYTDGDPAGLAYLELASVTRELAKASNVDHDYDAYLKTALAVLMSAVEHGAAPPASLQPIKEMTSDTNPEDHCP